jgi:Ser/Thr protein kinase RdoA (MazF antagonist)
MPSGPPAAPTLATNSPAALALKAAQSGQWQQAAAIVARLINDAFALSAQSVQISRDAYSFNSVNGFVRLDNGEQYFFKFHHEEGEEVTLEELYRGELLRDAGYPVDLPVYVSKQIGRQLLLYRRRDDPRFVEVCAGLDFRPPDEAESALRAQSHLDQLTCGIYLRTLHAVSSEQVAREPIHQLFHYRLVNSDAPNTIGGRARRFFWDRTFDIGEQVMSAEQLRAAHWRINGLDYVDTIDELFERSMSSLQPTSLARFGAVTAHGDAHNANVWWQARQHEAPQLILFDPAFAGAHISALLAEVKATFHNVFAHPLWLYNPAQAGRLYTVHSQLAGDSIEITTDWRPSALRLQFLRSKAEWVWRPLLRQLAANDLLAADWRSTLRCALFCCPTLVKDLCAGGDGGHTPLSSALGLSIAVRCGSEPAAGAHDEISDFLDEIAPGR